MIDQHLLFFCQVFKLILNAFDRQWGFCVVAHDFPLMRHQRSGGGFLFKLTKATLASPQVGSLDWQSAVQQPIQSPFGQHR
jgi:hypothetical protein